MCTLITTAQKPKPRVAKADIVVYKTGYKHYTEDDDPVPFRSAYRNYIYRPDELHSAEFSFNEEFLTSDTFESEYKDTIPENRRCYVSRGFHSFASISRADRWYDRNALLAEFVIPKGASYYINKAENVVSNQIIFKRFV